jgi:hypothetical protein
LLSYAAIAHTPGLRIRFVRFRQTVWRVLVIVTTAAQYNGERTTASNLARLRLRPPRLRLASSLTCLGS